MEAMTDLCHFVKKGLFMMFNGRTLAKNLQLFMDLCLLWQQYLTRNAILFLSLELAHTTQSDGIQEESVSFVENNFFTPLPFSFLCFSNLMEIGFCLLVCSTCW
nr:hypothetical protein Iba_scaffold48026CG0010 [Ipomoea batatas]